MVDVTAVLADTDAPATDHELLDVRDLPPPEPLSRTLDRVGDLNGDVLVQVNDRAPQHLFPQLDDRGFAYETVERGERVVTVVWR